MTRALQPRTGKYGRLGADRKRMLADGAQI